MPGSLEVVLVFVVLVVPGVVLLGGYNRTRAQTRPGSDFGTLVQALIWSIAWFPIAWLLGGRCVGEWVEHGTLDEHETAVVGIVFGLSLLAPLAVGLIVGAIVDRLGEDVDSPMARRIAWTGVFNPPTAWDATWERALGGKWAAVEIRLKTGEQFNVIFDGGSELGLSPGPRDLFFDTEYRWVDGEPEIESHEGIYINAAEVISVRIEYIEPEQATQAAADESGDEDRP